MRSAIPTQSGRWRWQQRSVGTWMMRHRYADAVDWIDRALAKAGAPAGSGQRASAR
jgi:hypothetical protein